MKYIRNIVLSIHWAGTATSTAVGNVSFHPILSRMQFVKAIEGWVVGSPVPRPKVDHTRSHSTWLQRLVESAKPIDFQCPSRAVQRSETSVLVSKVVESPDGSGCGWKTLWVGSWLC